MQLGNATRAVGGGLVASVSERAAVAELMTPLESLVGRPPRYYPPSAGELIGRQTLLLGAPGEPDDDE